MKFFRLAILPAVLFSFFAFCGTVFGDVVYEQPIIGQGINIKVAGDYHKSFYMYYVGGISELANPPVTSGFIVPRAYNKVRIKKMLGTSCSNITAGTNLDSFNYGHEVGEDYCEFYIYDGVGNAGQTNYLYFFGNGQDLVFDGSSANAGVTVDGYNDHSIPGGYAFQFCESVCDRDFILGPVTDPANYPTRIFAFDVSTSTKTASVHEYLNPNDLGAKINFNITDSAGQFFTSSVTATTTGEFYYTWNFPEFPENKTGFDDYTFYTDIATSTVIKSKSVKMHLEVPIIGRPGYGNSGFDSSQQIGSSFNHLIQTLGTNLFGSLKRIDIQSSNPSAIYYGSQTWFSLYECDDDAYGKFFFDGSNCKFVNQFISDTMGKLDKSVESFYPDLTNPVILNPTKYYYFVVQGNNQFNSLPIYYGSSADNVDGACYQYSLGQEAKVTPCATVADLYFRLYGITKAPPTPTIDPVIIIPGIMGSAYKNGKLIIDPILHTYDDLIDTLKANGYEEGKDLFTFAYEWRNSNVESANLLKDKISEVKEICKCSKVDLVAHSMGGLVAREYIQSGQYRHDVDQVIFLGTPHKGSPSDYLRWEAGEFESGTFNILTKKFFQVEALEHFYTSLFDYIQKYPIASVQNLLPVFDYLKDKNTGVLRTYPNNYPKNVFLEALDLNTGLQKLLNSGVRITNIVGNAGATSTIEKIRVTASSSPLWLDGKPDGFDGQTADRGLEMGAGDGTVTINGATLDSLVANQVVSGEHQKLPTMAEAKIYNILTGKTAQTTFDRDHGVDVKVLLLQLLSPVDFVITDPNGRRIGKNFATGEEYNEIPGAFYSGYQTAEEYISIPNPLDGDYKIQLQGTGSGKYTVDTSYVGDTTSNTAEIVGTTVPNQINNLDLTLNNVHPESISVDPDIISDINKCFDSGWIKDKKIKDALIKEVQFIVKFEKKFDIIKQKKVEKIEKKIDKILAKLVKIELDGLLKKKIINQQAYNLLKSDLDWLINN